MWQHLFPNQHKKESAKNVPAESVHIQSVQAMQEWGTAKIVAETVVRWTAKGIILSILTSLAVKVGSNRLIVCFNMFLVTIEF